MINVGEWIKKWSAIQPKKKALIFEDHPFTYFEVNQRTNQLCNLFLEMGVKQGERVAVLLRNCNQYIEIFFGLSKVGAILVPLNWRLAGSELEFIINDSDSRMLIFEPEFEGVVISIHSKLNIPIGNYLTVGHPCPDWAIDYEKAISRYASQEPILNGVIGGEDPHIIMYTSGTTGLPKGAILSHRKTFFNILNADLYYGLTSEDVMCVFRPLFHSGGLLVEAAPILYKGGTLVLRKRFRPYDILETIQKYRVTIVEMAGTTFQFILQECNLDQYDRRSVRCFYTGGERIPISLLKEYYEKGIVISQIFGQTEASTITFLPPEVAPFKLGSVGIPVFHGEVKIVDKMGKDVKPGKVGEIIVKGPTLMNGYWNRSDLTAEAIRDGWLYTGDLARMDEDGYYYIFDRKKDMYISGGENVYPAEIEKVLHTHEKILDVGIVGVVDERWGEVGKAFIVLKPGEKMDEVEALEFLKGKVAKYKTPKYVAFIDELPKTASGKIQKFVLKKWNQNRIQGTQDSSGQVKILKSI